VERGIWRAKRLQLVRYRSAQIRSIEGLLMRQTGARMKSESVKALTAEQVEQFGFAPDVALAVQANRAVSQTLGQQIETLEKRLRERVSLRGEFKLLNTVPGIGETLATTIMRGGPNRALCPGGQFQFLLPLRGEPAREQWQEEGRRQRQERQQVLGPLWKRRTSPCVTARKPRVSMNARSVRLTASWPSRRSRTKLARACYHMLREHKPFDVNRCFA
jgi:transposase